MDRDEAARLLDGLEYGREEDREVFARMKEAGLVAVFGSSDDLVEMRGAIRDEFGTGPIRMTSSGVLSNDCRNADCPYFKLAAKHAPTIRGEYGDAEPYWRFETTIPHATFRIMEDGEVFCQGIVISLADVDAP